MWKKQYSNFVIIFIMVAGIVLFNCTSPSSINDINDTSEKSTVIGCVYTQSGPLLIPVENATVTFIQSDAYPDSSSVLTVSTDKKGYYEIVKSDFILSKKYNVFAEKGSKKGYRNQAILIKDSISNDSVPHVTLNETGSITGVILLKPEHANDKAIILFKGTNFYYRPDVNGVFTLDSLAAGNYEAHIIAEPDGYKPYDTVFTIRSGFCDTLQDTIRLGGNTIPIVTGVKISYDSSLLMANLSWDRSDATDIEGYFVYRAIKGMVLKEIEEKPVKDTFFFDDVIQYEDTTLIYSVVVVDKYNNRSKLSEIVEIEAKSLFLLENTHNLDTELKGKFLYSLLYDKSSDKIYGGCDYKVFRFNRDGSGFESLTSDSGTANEIFARPWSIGTDKNNNSYILDDMLRFIKLDSGFNIIYKKQLDTTGERGCDFSVTPEGEIFLKKGFNDNITLLKYDSTFTLIKTHELFGESRYMRFYDKKLLLLFSLRKERNFVLKSYDTDLNFIDSVIVKRMENDTGQHAKGYTEVIDGYNGNVIGFRILRSLLNNWLYEITVISPQNKIIARTGKVCKNGMKDLRNLIMDCSNNIYRFDDTNNCFFIYSLNK